MKMHFNQYPSFQQNQTWNQFQNSSETFNGFSATEIAEAKNHGGDKFDGDKMKVKEIDVTANVAWSPKTQYPVLLAAGTAAQQLDASFDTTSLLEIYSLNLSESGHGMPKVSSVAQEHRFHSLVWGQNVLIGGMEKGFVQVFDANKIIKGQENPVVFSKDKHTGAVNSLDLNPFQGNLLASGASESEVFIWDLNKLTMPMNPGPKSQPLEDVRSVAWNRQVQHILATASSSKCVVWDLRKNEPIIKVSDSGTRMRYKPVAWHPEVATQLCLASEDDHSPVIQIWDLRSASSPLKTLDAHHKGILSVAWCQEDSDLLLSCGKDNRIICWNPNSDVENGEVLCELNHSNQWSFNVNFCPRNPAVISASSFDSRVSIYSLMGGQQQVEPSSNIADSFPGMETMAPVAQVQATKTQSVQLKQPPKWLKRPCGANFGFGGKIVTFEFDKATKKSAIKLGSVVTENNLVERSVKLETSLQNGNLSEFCQSKMGQENKDAKVWQYINANFEQDPRMAFLSLLDYQPEKVREKISEMTGTVLSKPKDEFVSDRIDEVTDEMSNLDTNEDDFAAIAKQSEAKAKLMQPFDICTDDSGPGYLSKALLTGNIELAVELCLEQNRMADAIILALQGNPELIQKVQEKYFEKNTSKELPLIRAVVNKDWSQVINCVTIQQNWKEALVAVLTYAENDQFCDYCSLLGNKLEELNMKEEALLCFIVARNLDQVVSCWMQTRQTSNSQSPDDLQDLVEVVMALKSAAEFASGAPVEVNKGPLSAQLTKYAGILASQGALSAALTYLGQSNEESINLLRERLTGALGQYNQPRKISTGSRLTRKSNASGGSGSAFNGIQNPAIEQNDPFAPSRFERRTSRPPVDNYSDPYAGGYQSYQGYQPNPAPAPPQNPSQPMPNIFTPDYSQSYAPPPTATPGPPPMGSAPPTGLPKERTMSESSNRSFGLDHGPPVSSGPGWNDPPAAALALAKSRAAAKTTTTNAITSPITQPLLGMPEPEPQQPPMNYGYYGQQQFEPQPPPPPANLFQPQQVQPPQNFNYGGGGFQQPPQAQPQQVYQPPPVQEVQQAPPEPPKPVEKGPIPSEHQIIQEVFDGLKNKCLTASNHPQIKRKLADVGKKLEVLYDKLRDGVLPPNVTTGLHQMVQYIWAFDYNSCLQVINQMVSGGSFTLLAEFLPGVKVLIQVSSQLGVYIERPQ